MIAILTKVINSVPYRPYRPEYTVPAVPARIYRTGQQSDTLDFLFRTGKNTGHTGLVPAVLANFGQYRPVPGVPADTEKIFFFFFFF